MVVGRQLDTSLQQGPDEGDIAIVGVDEAGYLGMSEAPSLKELGTRKRRARQLLMIGFALQLVGTLGLLLTAVSAGR